MIFITTGTQVQFDRLIQAMDEIAPSLHGQEIIAQAFDIKYQAKNIKTLEYIAPIDFKSYVDAADLIISHAGTGTILSVAQMEKPLIVFPRLGKLREARNDHQLATCRKMEEICLLQVAYDEVQLKEKIDAYFRGELPVMNRVSPYASAELLNNISDFIASEKRLNIIPQTI